MNITTAMTPDSIRSNSDITSIAGVKVLIDLGKREQLDGQRMFRTVCAMIIKSPEMIEKFEGGLPLSDFMDAFGQILTDGLPEGENPPIAKKTGKPAFRSWAVTKVRYQYANILFNAFTEQGSVNAVLPSDKPLPTLADVKKLQKQKSESPLETIKRALTLAEGKMEELSQDDFSQVDMAVASIMGKWGQVKTETTGKVTE